MADSIIQQINEGGVEQLAPPSALQTQVKKNPELLRDFLSQLFGIKDAVRAYKGEMTEDEAQNFALTAALGVIPMAGELGPAARAAEEVAPEAAQSITQMIRAYHGSPYDFDKFDLSKIGTGEGAQAYGHGLYFAEHPNVAEMYKRQYVPNKSIAGRLGLAPAEIPNPEIPGRMYEVNINADPEHFLDWDKPLSEQSPQVQSKVEPFLEDRFVESNPLGSEIHAQMTHGKSWGHSADATEILRQAGIPGIRYLDQGSRPSAKIQGQIDNLQRYIDEFADDKHPAVVAKRNEYVAQQSALKDQLSKQTHNYVVFDDKLVDIIKKYGLAGLVAGGASNFMPKQK